MLSWNPLALSLATVITGILVRVGILGLHWYVFMNLFLVSLLIAIFLSVCPNLKFEKFCKGGRKLRELPVLVVKKCQWFFAFLWCAFILLVRKMFSEWGLNAFLTLDSLPCLLTHHFIGTQPWYSCGVCLPSAWITNGELLDFLILEMVGKSFSLSNQPYCRLFL